MCPPRVASISTIEIHLMIPCIAKGGRGEPGRRRSCRQDGATRRSESFKETTAKEREGILCRAAEILQRDKDEFAQILIDEVGSPTFKAYFEIEMATDMLRAAAGMTRNITGQTIPSDHPGRFSMSVRAPLGVVASITPFNVPLIKGVRLSCNPIACGNSVVLLPSEEAPMLARRLGDLVSGSGIARWRLQCRERLRFRYR